MKRSKTICGSEKRSEVLSKFNLDSPKRTLSFVYINGIPHRPNKDGNLVPLKLVSSTKK